MDHENDFLHATLSTADLALSTTSTEIALLPKDMGSTSGNPQAFVHVDSYLFSDDDDFSETRATPKVSAVEQDVVPDSSDEASTGPALDMDLDEAEGSYATTSLVGPAAHNDNAYVHLEASSGTRQAFKASHMDYESVPMTIDPRRLAVQPSSFVVNKTPQARDSDPHTSQAITSVATTEVVPSEREDTVSEKTVSPVDRPGMLGKAFLQGLRTESAAEAVKNRQRPKAKPLVLASKEVRAAIRRQSPPQSHSKKPVSKAGKASTSKLPDDDEETEDDDELRLKANGSHSSHTTVQGGSRSGSLAEKSRVEPARVLEIDIGSDGDGDGPIHRPSKFKKSVSKNFSKGKGKDISDSDFSDGSVDKEREILRARQEADTIMAKESEDDSDYDGKGAATDKWGKKGKKKKETRKPSKATSEEPKSKKATRIKTAKGQPSAVYPNSRKGKSRASRASRGDNDDSESDEPVQVGTVRKTSKTSKQTQGKESKERSVKGPEPRSKEFLDDEDMADDQVTTTWSKLHEPIAPEKPKEVSQSSAPRETSEAMTEPLPPSSDAPISARPKPSKTYGKNVKKSVARVEDSEEDYTQLKTQSAVSVPTASAERSSEDSANLRREEERQRSRSGSQTAPISRSKRSNFPPFAVIIESNAKKTRPPPSKGNAVATVSKRTDADQTSTSIVSRAEESSSKPIGKAQTSSKRKAATARIADSEEDESEENNEAQAKQVTQSQQSTEDDGEDLKAAKKDELVIKVDPPRNVLQNKDGNAVLPAVQAAKDTKPTAITTPSRLFKGKNGLADSKPIILSTGKRFHDMVVAKGGGQGIRPQGLSKRTAVPTLLSFRGVPPPKKKPLPPAPVKKKKKGEEVYSDDDLEELNDQPEDWWERDDFYAWEQRKRKRAKAKGEIDSDDERELTEKQKKMKKETSPVPAGGEAGEVEHFSD